MLCPVAVSELMVTASQRHVIPLQGRPYEEDQVSRGGGEVHTAANI